MVYKNIEPEGQNCCSKYCQTEKKKYKELQVIVKNKVYLPADAKFIFK